MIRERIVLAVMGGITAALTLAACGSGNGSSGSAAPANGPAASSPAAAAKSGGTAGGGAMVTTNMLMAKQTKALGKIVTDHKGYILYRYGKDMKSMSMCTGVCTKKWLPLMAGSTTPQVMGMNPKLIGTFTRADGMKQLTLGGWPLYRYAADTKPGEWKGQGMGGVWHVVTPAGKMAMGRKTRSTTGGTGSGNSGSMKGMNMGGS
jgi:predicted lipoprotein with Yx(FWY)xxD motif